MPRIGVILSGCGVHDGAEVHESVIAMLALARQGAEVVCLAPDRPQAKVFDHYHGKDADEPRNVLVEAARIARGEVRDTASVSAADVDGIVLPGGFGAALNLSTFASQGPDAKVDPSVAKLIRDCHAAAKPIGAICIAPAVVALVLADAKPKLTIGTDPGTADALQTIGAVHEPCSVEEICIDEKNRIVSTPAYMLGPGIQDVAVGIEKLVEAIVTMTRS